MSAELIVATFHNDENAANEQLEALKGLAKHDIHVEAAGAVSVSQDGKAHVKDLQDSAKHGRWTGALIGGAAGLLVGPFVAIGGALLGAVVGDDARSISDYGVPRHIVEQLEGKLQAGDSALIVYADTSWSNKVIEICQESGAEIYRSPLDETRRANLD